MLLTTVAFAQSDGQKPPGKPKSPDNPIGAFNKNVYGRLKVVLLNSAQKMPEESNAFKPTAAVYSYGQIVGHVADAQYMFCSIELGEKNPAPRVEQTKTLKADLVATLKDAFAYGDKSLRRHDRRVRY